MGFATYSAATPTLFAAAGDGSEAVGVGDFNHDGIPDLAVSNHNDGTLSILLGQVAGGYLATATIPYRSPLNVFSQGSVSIADLNRDGWDDVVVASNGSAGVFVVLATGPATFAAPASIGVGTSVLFATIADLNRDGIPDIIAAENNTSRLSILLGTGSGTFAAPSRVATGAGPFAVAVADFNGDGKPDLASANVTDNSVSVFYGTGSGTFSLQTTVAGPGPSLSITSVAAGDVNGDGFADLVTTSQATVAGTSSVTATFLSDRAGGFTAAGTVAVPARPTQVLIADMNRDGALDLALLCRGTSQVQVLLGTGSGAFSVPGPAAVPAPGDATAIGMMAIADLNRDGILDIAVPVFNSDGVSILMASPVAAPTVLSFATDTVQVGSSPSAIDVGDFNRDGRLDFVTSNNQGGSVSVVNGMGGGAFGSAVDYPVQPNPFSVAVGDFDRNGRPDVLTNNNSTGDASALLNDGAGGMGMAQSYVVGHNNLQTALGDLNRDGILDAAIADNNSSHVSILLGNASGGFGPPTLLTVGASPFAAVVADFNRDGRPDIASANALAGSVTVLMGDGTGGFSAHSAATDFLVGALPRSIAAGDFNGNGKVDLVAANATSGTLSILLGVGDGTFLPATTVALSAGAAPEYVRAGDLNGDGRLDLVVSNNGNGTLSMLLGNGSGGFSAPQTFTVGGKPLGLALADFNQDGQLDIVVTNGAPSGNTVTVLLNSTVPPNLAPVASLSLPTEISPSAGCVAPVWLDGSASFDPDGDAITYRWTDNGIVIGNTSFFSRSLAVGSHTMTLTVDDRHGHVARTTSTVLVRDTTPPSIGAPAFQTLEAANAAGAFFDPSATVSDNCDTAPTLTIVPTLPGNIFPIGDTTVTYTATDHASPANVSTTSIVVSVTKTPPAMTPHANEVAEATSIAGATVVYAAPTATDVAGATLAVTCAPESGLVFPIGNTSVTCSASDARGFSTTAQFFVTVRDTTAPTVTTSLTPAPAGTFAPPKFFEAAYAPKQHRPWDLAVADFDGDGKRDVVITENGAPASTDGRDAMQFTIIRGNGAGGFFPPVRYNLGVVGRRAMGTQGVAVGDFNKDGKPDVATTVSDYGADDVTLSHFVAVSLNRGDGTFQPPTRLATLDYPYSLAVGDTDADGYADLAVAGTTGIDVLCSDIAHRGAIAAGSLVRCQTLSDTNLFLGYRASVAVSDFNGDGRVDVATVDSFTQSALLWLSTPQGFGAPTRFATDANPIGIAAADLNGDGRMDIVTLQHRSFSALLGNGAGSFGPHVDQVLDRADPWKMTLADLNADGRLDIAITDDASFSVWVALGSGTGAFATANPIDAGGFEIGIAAADMNGDGKLDLLAGGWYRPQGSLLLNGFTSTQTVAGPPMTEETVVPAVATGFMSPDGSAPMTMAVTVSDNIVTFVEPTAFDLVDGVLPVTCDTPSGSDLPLGTNRITCWATDSAGNTGSVAFDVVVTDAPPPPPVATPGRMHGEGFVGGQGKDIDQSRFEFDITETAIGADRGKISFSTGHDDDREREARRAPHRHNAFKSTSLTSVVFTDDPAVRSGRRRAPGIDTVEVHGTGQFNGVAGYTFTMIAVDAGEPGRGTDTFTLTVFAPNGTKVIDVTGRLGGGNVQSTRLTRRD